MCGLFGFDLAKPVSLKVIFSILQKLEMHQYPDEARPVGGYGAGIATLRVDGTVYHEKIGKTGSSPVEKLAETVDLRQCNVLMAHVRMPSPEFMKTARHRETAQPYLDERDPDSIVVSIHNGKLDNYKELRRGLGSSHPLESENIELIDSEVLPHLYGNVFSENQDVMGSLYEFFCRIKGSNTISLLQANPENSYLHIVHKGKTRGLHVWTNSENEFLFCSRREPVLGQFGRVLSRRAFEEKISITHKEHAGLILSHMLISR